EGHVSLPALFSQRPQSLQARWIRAQLGDELPPEGVPALLLAPVGPQEPGARREIPDPAVEAVLLHASRIETHDEQPEAVDFFSRFVDRFGEEGHILPTITQLTEDAIPSY